MTDTLKCASGLKLVVSTARMRARISPNVFEVSHLTGRICIKRQVAGTFLSSRLIREFGKLAVNGLKNWPPILELDSALEFNVEMAP